jgi:chemotaxis protein methyltransferase CheR
LSDALYRHLAELVQAQTGIQLGPQKMNLVRARIAKRMRRLHISDLETYCRHLADDTTSEEMTNLLDAVSTNVTYFFREADHFDVFARHVNEWVAQGRRRLRVWSAGCSSGEEPYTLCIVLHEKAHLSKLTDVKILATDLCTEMLERGRRAVYPATRLKDLSRFLLSKYFQRNRDLKNALYRVKEPLRRMVTFRRLNFMDMMHGPLPFRGPFDAIFCRNVMIYFDVPTRQRMVDCYHDVLRSGGLFFTGRAESLTGLTHRFKMLQPSAYRK